MSHHPAPVPDLKILSFFTRFRNPLSRYQMPEYNGSSDVSPPVQRSPLKNGPDVCDWRTHRAAFPQKTPAVFLKIIKQQIRRFRLHKKCAVMNVCDLHVLKTSFRTSGNSQNFLSSHSHSLNTASPAHPRPGHHAPLKQG